MQKRQGMGSVKAGLQTKSHIFLALLLLGLAHAPLVYPQAARISAPEARSDGAEKTARNFPAPGYDTSADALTGDEIILADEETDTAEPESLSIAKLPELTAFVEADYPPEIYKQGIDGTVLMDLVVSDSGTVDSVSIVKSLHPVLDSSAAAAARKFVFTPALLANGEPVSVVLQYEYRFSLREVTEKVEKYVNFTGLLLERGTRKPLSDAMVVITFIDTLSDTSLPVPFGVYRERLGQFEGQYLEEDKLVTLTDSAGRFSFYSLPACSIEVTAPAPGYEQLRERERIHAGEELSVTYYVQRVSYADYEIMVYGKTEEKEVARRQLTLNEVKKIPGLSGDAVKVVQALPGVARASFGAGAVIVRGAPTWDSRFFLDGVAIPTLYHFGGVKSTYNSDALASVDLYPGGFNSRYGGAIAGIVEIKGRPARNDRWHAKLDANLFDGSVLLEGPVTDKVAVLASARRSFIGDVLGWAVENLDFINLPVTVTPFYWDYIVRTDFDLFKNHHNFLTLFGSRDRLRLIVPNVRGGSREISDAADQVDVSSYFNMALAGWDWKAAENIDNELRCAVTHSSGRSSIFGTAKWEYGAWEYYIRNNLLVKPGDRLGCNIGLDVDLTRLNQRTKFPTFEESFLTDTIDDWFGVTGGYVNVEWKPLERLTFIPSIRYDYFPELQYDGSIVPAFWDYHVIDNNRGLSGEPSFRLTGRWEFVKRHTLKAAIGNYSQTPQPAGAVINKTIGNPYLPATKARHTVVGYEWQATDLIFADIQGYYNRQWDIPRFADERDILVDPASRVIADEEARSYGLEVLLRHDQGERFFGWIAYTLARSERLDAPDSAWVLYSRDQTHNLQLIGNYRLGRNWEAGARLRFVSGNPYTPIVGRTYDFYNRTYIPEFGEPRSLRSDPFFQIDLRVDKKFVFKKWILSAYIDAQNVAWFAYKSPEFQISNYDYTERQPISAPFVPSLGIAAEF